MVECRIRTCDLRKGGAQPAELTAHRLQPPYPESDRQVDLILGMRVKTSGRLAQLVRAPALQAGGRRFEPCTAHHMNQYLVVAEFEISPYQEASS